MFFLAVVYWIPRKRQKISSQIIHVVMVIMGSAHGTGKNQAFISSGNHRGSEIFVRFQRLGAPPKGVDRSPLFGYSNKLFFSLTFFHKELVNWCVAGYSGASSSKIHNGDISIDSTVPQIPIVLAWKEALVQKSLLNGSNISRVDLSSSNPPPWEYVSRCRSLFHNVMTSTFVKQFFSFLNRALERMHHLKHHAPGYMFPGINLSSPCKIFKLFLQLGSFSESDGILKMFHLLMRQEQLKTIGRVHLCRKNTYAVELYGSW